jgi:hypothetical protein
MAFPQSQQPQGYQPQYPQSQGYQPQYPQPQGYQPQYPQSQGYQPQYPQPQGYQPQYPQPYPPGQTQPYGYVQPQPPAPIVIQNAVNVGARQGHSFLFHICMFLITGGLWIFIAPILAMRRSNGANNRVTLR